MILKCKICGGNLEVAENSKIAICEYCGNEQTLPKIKNEQKAKLYDRGLHFIQNNEYDKAIAIYETILNEDNTDSEIQWQLVLCDYGVEYVKDKKTNKYIPTCNRTKNESIFENENYKNAIKYADKEQKAIYEAEAKKIDEIQKSAIEIARKEEPFDIFISYKETDENGNRTEDSVIAQDLYNNLSKQGYKVFFSKITLENKLGTEYEPYIFSALNSSKIMIVVATKKEYIEAPWVKNEWNRFLGLAKEDESKLLIPTYKNMNPYDLPEEFAHLQAVNLEKIGVLEDLKIKIDEIIHKTIKEKVKSSINYKKRKRLIIISLIILCTILVLGLGIIITNKFLLSEIKYKKAEKYISEEKYDEAIKILEKLENYKESNSKILDCNIKIKEKKKDSVSKYIGRYDKTETRINEINNLEEPSGYILEIMKASGHDIEFSLAKYGHRIASFTAIAKLKNDIYEFKYQDSWENKGKGTLKLLEDSIEITLETPEYNQMANCDMGEGLITFKISDKAEKSLAYTNVEKVKERVNILKGDEERINADIQKSKNRDNRMNTIVRVYTDSKAIKISEDINSLLIKYYNKSYLVEKNECIYEDESENIEYIISCNILSCQDFIKDLSKLYGIIKIEDTKKTTEEYIKD